MLRARLAAKRWPFVLLACLVASAPAHGQDNVFTPQHVAKLRVITEAVISPDGTLVAYVLAVPRELPKEKDGPAWTELHVVDTKGNSTPFVSGPVNVGSIAWTPDGKQIAFLAKRDKDETRCLYAISPRGGEARKLLAHSTDIQGYSFSGDGKQLAFLATEPVPAATKKEREQGFNQEIYEEDSPFIRVWITDLASREHQRPEQAPPVADAPGSPRMLKLIGHASELHFNPKEDKVAVALAPSPGIDDHIMFRKVHIVDLKTGKATNLNNPGKLGQLAWSPGGEALSMITGADKHDPKEGRLWFHVQGREGWKDLFPTFTNKGHVESTSWGAVQVSVGTSAEVGYVNKETVFGGVRWPETGLIASNVSASRKMQLGFIGHTPHHPPEVYYVADPDVTKEPKRLTNSNPWLKNMKFAKQEVVKYKARDGLDLEGILIRPLNEKPGQRYPLVLTVHGGPEAHYANGWLTLYHSLGQVGAARGMAVFYPNYRGSTGYGVEFSMKGQKEAAGKEFDDLIDGVDHLIKMGLVDAKKVGITGGSYGGYATAWGSTYYSDRFAAGVMFVGLSNLVSCAGTTDIPQEMFLVHHRKWLWDDWDYFAKASPIKYLDRHKTPLLILHGKADPRVHPSQSLELYRHLKVRNQAPVRLVLYPGEGHGNRRAASRLDYNIRLLQWMEHYLKGPGGAMPPLQIDYGISAKGQAAASGSWRTPRRDEESCWTGLSAMVGAGCPCCLRSWP